MKYFFLLFSVVLTFCSKGQISPSLMVPRGHKDIVRNCFFTPNDKYLVSTDDDHVLCIWDGDDGRQLFILRDSLASFNKIEINKAGSVIAACTDSGQLYIIDFIQLQVKARFYNIAAFSMNKGDGSIFFITRDGQLNKCLAPAFNAVNTRYTKTIEPARLFALSVSDIAVEDKKRGILVINSNTGAAWSVTSPGLSSLTLFDFHPAGYLLCGNIGPASATILRVGIKTHAVSEKILINGSVGDLDAVFSSNPEHIIAKRIEREDDDLFMVKLHPPVLYAMKTGKEILELGSEYVADLGEMNLNFSHRNVVAKRILGFEYQFFLRYDFAMDTSYQVLGGPVTQEADSKFACANKGQKIAIFKKDLLFPVICRDGVVNENAPRGIKKYNDLSIDITRSPDKIKGAHFSFLFSDETIINDSVRLVTSDTADAGTNLYTGIIYRQTGNDVTDSFRFLYQQLLKPFPGSEHLFWSADSVFYVLDIPGLAISNRISFRGSKIEKLNKAGKDILIQEQYEAGGRTYKYNISQKMIADTIIMPGQFIRPYIEDNYSRYMEGYSISDAEINDYDYLHDIVWKYPFITDRVDTVAVYDSAFEIISYQAVKTEAHLSYEYLGRSNDKYIYLSDEIEKLPVLQVRYWDDSCYIIMTRQNKLFVYSLKKDTITKKIDCPTSAALVFPGKSFLFIQEHNKYLIVSFKDRNDCFIVDVPAGKIIAHLNGFYNPRIRQPADLLVLEDAAFGNFYVYNNKTYQYVSLVTPFSKIDYVVNTASGLFDGTDKAIENLYLLINDAPDKNKPWKTIDLTQLKAKYYIPGLWDKLVTGDSTDLPDVESIKNISLAPEITTDSSYSFTKPYKITLLDKGGGIGAVRLVVNGKEIIADARKNKVTRGNKIMLAIDLKPYKNYFGSGPNTIQVFSSNTDSSLTSRGLITASSGKTEQPANPKLFIISIGTSNYKGSEIDLQYSSKDAIDIGEALKAGAKNLFSADSTIAYILTSNAADTSLLPSKSNIEKTFREVSKKATAKDIIVLYLSGHGINTGGDFYYLTKDAYTANSSAYVFKEVLKAVAISSNEITEYLKKIPAQKQLFIIDACASGKIVENLIAHRDIPYSTLKALDRLKDRTGTHIITGCAADAVSYEASRFGQGLLTYSLLEGMKGASLRDNKFLDVAQWFQYARERVPKLATGLGGIQTPQVYSPAGNQSFDIAELDEEVKKQVPLAAEKPVFIKSVFQEEENFADMIALGRFFDNTLYEASSMNTKSSFLFLPIDEFPNAYQVLGRYTINGHQITATIKIIKADSPGAVRSFSLIAADKKALSAMLLEKIKELK